MKCCGNCANWDETEPYLSCRGEVKGLHKCRVAKDDMYFIAKDYCGYWTEKGDKLMTGRGL